MLHQGIDVGGAAGHITGDHAVGQGVHDQPEALTLVGLGGPACLTFEEPPQRAGQQRLQHRGPQTDRLIHRAHRARGHRPGPGPPPTGRVGRGHDLTTIAGDLAESGQPLGCGLTQGRLGALVDQSATKLGHDSLEGHRPSGSPLDVGRGDADLLQESGGLLPGLVGVGDRGEDQVVPGPGAGDVEETTLLGEEFASGRRVLPAVGADAVGLEQRGAAAKVRPGLLLDVGNHHQRPLQPFGAVGGEQSDSATADPSVSEGVGWDLLGGEHVEERLDAGVAALLLGTGGEFEQRTDRVEVAVSQPGSGTTSQGGRAQPSRPRGALPQHPQHLFHAVAGVESCASSGQQVGQPGCLAHDLLLRAPGRARAWSRGGRVGGQHAGVDQHVAQQLSRATSAGAGARRLSRVVCSQGACQSAYLGGVEATEW